MGKETYEITQKEISNAVDIQSATKVSELLAAKLAQAVQIKADGVKLKQGHTSCAVAIRGRGHPSRSVLPPQIPLLNGVWGRAPAGFLKRRLRI